MLPPVSQPTGKYAPSPALNLSDLPIWGGEFSILEPTLIDTRAGWQPDKTQAAPVAAAVAAASSSLGAGLECSAIGGKLTVFVYCSGPNQARQLKCLESIVLSVPGNRMSLRIALCGVSRDVVLAANSLDADHLVVYEYPQQMGKYEVMRDMFNDESDPIETPFIAWFDDTCYVSEANWLNFLAAEITRQTANVGMYGLVYYYLPQDLAQVNCWLKSASWYKGRKLQLRSGREAPNGDTIHFCADWFWVMRTAAIRDCQIPDARIGGRGGDIAIGAQLHQSGYLLKSFNTGKSLVCQPRAELLPAKDTSLQLPWE